jgi:hypothetical protein
MKIIKLETLKNKNLLYKIAKAKINQKGVYFCLIDNKKSKVIP